ncbi:hypothetical protein [Mycolicibacterium sp. A43C]
MAGIGGEDVADGGAGPAVGGTECEQQQLDSTGTETEGAAKQAATCNNTAAVTNTAAPIP